MKYLALRVDTSAIKNHKVVKGYFVRGQKDTDYNWELLGEFDSMDSAKHFIKSIRTDFATQRIYGPDGYEIHL